MERGWGMRGCILFFGNNQIFWIARLQLSANSLSSCSFFYILFSEKKEEGSNVPHSTILRDLRQMRVSFSRLFLIFRVHYFYRFYFLLINKRFSVEEKWRKFLSSPFLFSPQICLKFDETKHRRSYPRLVGQIHLFSLTPLPRITRQIFSTFPPRRWRSGGWKLCEELRRETTALWNENDGKVSDRERSSLCLSRVSVPITVAGRNFDQASKNETRERGNFCRGLRCAFPGNISRIFVSDDIWTKRD